MTNQPTPFDPLINSYLDNKIGIDAGFLSKDLSEGLRQNIVQLEKDNQMIPAGVGNAYVKDPQQKMRGDKTYWMDKEHENIYEKEFLRLAEDLIAHLNQTCYTGINGYEFHYAVYEEGSFYRRHRDQFMNDNDRKYSLICYLNENWQEEDGGQLWVYHKEGIQKIAPRSQTAIFFKSNELEHEVRLANCRRTSVSGWLKQV